MKLLINTSNLFVGGGVQVALSFIEELKSISGEHEYHIALSPVISNHISRESFPDNFYFHSTEYSPANLRKRNAVIRTLDQIVEQADIDIVFTIFGPSYWRPDTKHLLGIADGWVYNPGSVAYRMLNIVSRIKRRLHCRYKSYYFKRDATFYVVETDDAKNKLASTIGIDRDSISVIGNTYSSIFDDTQYLNESHESYIKLPAKETGEYRLLYIAHNHPNKNLAIINEVIPLLEDRKVSFILTLDDNSYQSLFPDRPENVLNIGPIAQKSCPSVYSQCDALFAPTLLETFSAAYPEAMKMGKPILTSGYSFAKDTCGDAAMYFDPLDANDIADKVRELISDRSIINSLTKNGERKLGEFETARSRAEKYVSLCEKIAGSRT